MKKFFIPMAALLWVGALALAACASSGQAVETTPAVQAPAAPAIVPEIAPLAGAKAVTLDEAISRAAAEMEARLQAGTTVALVNVSSPQAALSDYALTGLEAALVGSGKLVVVDRANLDKVRAEQGFQASGEVSEESAASIGRMLGAKVIVTGSLTGLGAAVYRFSLKAINVEEATVAVSFLADVAVDGRLEALAAASGTTAPNKPLAGGDLGGVWSGVLAYSAGGQSYRDSYRVSLYADGSCWVAVTAEDGAAQAALGYWSDEDGKFRLDCEFGKAAIPRLSGVHWLSLYALQNNKRALRLNIRPAPDYSGVAAITLYKE